MMVNSKFEFLNSKQIPNNKLQFFKRLGFETLRFKYCLGFRAYNLRIQRRAYSPSTVLGVNVQPLDCARGKRLAFSVRRKVFRVWKIRIWNLFENCKLTPTCLPDRRAIRRELKIVNCKPEVC